MKFKLKSQITMLLIVGLFIFILVSIVLYLSKSVVKKQIQQNIKIAQETAIETQPIKEFVVKCLDKLAKDATVLLGKQGGYIYTSQGGSLVDYEDTDEGLLFIKKDGFNIAYNILPPKFSIPPYSSEVPDYPWQTFPYKTSSSNAEIFEGFFGVGNMPPLNSSEGPNSMQFQIENFVDRNMESCANFGTFEKQGLEVTMRSSKTEVIIGNGDISIKSKIPITISNPATREHAELNDFSANINVRLKDTYFFIKELMENDIKNIKFDISGPNNSKDFFSIRKIENAVQHDDLIVVTDEKSLIYGKQFEYTFARRNRAPALYYIRKTTLEFPHMHIISQNDLMKNSNLMAKDPDEDKYEFTITPALPKKLDTSKIKFKVEVSDGILSDYQIITVNRI